MPAYCLTSVELARRRRSIELVFGGADIELASPVDLAHIKSNVGSGGFDATVLIDPPPALLKALSEAYRSRPVYVFRGPDSVQLSPLEGRLPHDDPALSHSIFHRLAPDRPDATFFFPGGYVHRQSGQGPIDAFGHRIDGVAQERQADEVIIAVFGGSAAWSVGCLPDETFAARLEDKLNARAAAGRPSRRARVVNYGLHGQVVLNEAWRFVTFCIDLKPDIVIAHDGYNDFVYGLVNDPELIGRHQLAYQETLEDWSPRLHAGWDLTAVRTPQERLKRRNSIEAIVRAYIVRKRQFETVVTGLGARFVWGLQPFLLSKGALSAREAAYLAARMADGSDPQRVFYDHTLELYQAFAKRTDWSARANRVDIHAAFAALGADVDHFIDFVHCTPAGDEVIAEFYASHLWQILARSEH